MCFEHGSFKGMTVDEQKKVVKNLARKIRSKLRVLGCKPKGKKSKK
jgi:hypothetical protein